MILLSARLRLLRLHPFYHLMSTISSTRIHSLWSTILDNSSLRKTRDSARQQCFDFITAEHQVTQHNMQNVTPESYIPIWIWQTRGTVYCFPKEAELVLGLPNKESLVEAPILITRPLIDNQYTAN